MHEKSFADLNFDGRKVETLKQIVVEEKCRKKVVQEEQMSIVVNPGCKYFGQILVQAGSVQELIKGLFDFMKEKGVTLVCTWMQRNNS